MDIKNFEFSDTISGYVTKSLENDVFEMETSDGRKFSVKLGANLESKSLRNLGEDYKGCSDQVRELLVTGQLVIAYGIFYPEKGGYNFEAKQLNFPDYKKGTYRFEEQDWWIKQAGEIARFYIKAQFGGAGGIDYKKYRTKIALTGQLKEDNRQETDTVSRLVFGLASTYLLTGDDIFLEAAEKGSQYMQEHMMCHDQNRKVAYWYHAVDIDGDKEHKILTSQFGDDYGAIPMYEQIYALAGITQTYRINGDPGILKNINLTIDLFDKYFHDKEKGGYFSHVEPDNFDPRSEKLGQNRAKKNWNSVGDHAPAFLINLCLATGEKKFYDFLKYTADTINEHFQDYENSPFIQEKFYEDWSHDKTWGWQQDRSVVGHNLKIAWNLMRINNKMPNPKYVEFARKIAETMPKVGMDKQRFGWYDVMERKLNPGEESYRFAWHDRKAWWQQEQGILAYQIMYGILKDNDYLKYARESTAFYNTFFLDYDDGAVYFNVMNNGMPYLLGTERLKGSHSMSGYHSLELAYLAAVYTNLLNTKNYLDMYFKPYPNGFADNILRVEPDMLPNGSIKISEVWVDGKAYSDFDAKNLTVKIPKTEHRPKIQVRIVPV